MPRSQTPPLRLRYWPLQQLPGLSQESLDLLSQQGIDHSQQLLQATTTPSQRRSLATRLHVHDHHVAKWRSLSDLARVPSVGDRFCGLLLHAGVTSLTHLAQATPHQVHRQILKLHIATLQRKDLCPTLADVSQWVQDATVITAYLRQQAAKHQ
ncbi:MAG: DUF4332 domain-containing protein [Kaiparowitsia implicata GSE-PSE-MK54-09C]|nr:DUF4332 domain-containing protein [Kaiparowitsia implicata GSE-PSE-MK54-09C]